MKRGALLRSFAPSLEEAHGSNAPHVPRARIAIVAAALAMVAALCVPLTWRSLPRTGAWLLILFGVIYAALHFMARRYGAPPVARRPGSRLELVALALPSGLVYAVVLLGMWPAQMSPDSIWQWAQVSRGHFNDTHPAMQTMLMWVVTRVWPSPAAVVAFHIFALALVTALVLRELRFYGVPAWVRGIAACAFPMLPANSLMVTTIWKDVTYTIALTGILYLLLALVRTAGERARSGSWRAAFVCASFVSMASRHNGLLPALAIPLACAVAYWRTVGRFFAACTAGLAVAYVLLKLALLPLLHVEPVDKHYRSIVAMHLIAAQWAAGTHFAPEEEALLQSALALDQWKARYDCKFVCPLFFGPGVTYGVLANRAGELNALAIRASLRNPKVFLHHLSCVTSPIWRIIPAEGEWMGYTPMQIDRIPGVDELGLSFAPKLPEAHRLMERIAAWSTSPGWVSLLWRPALWLLVSVVVASGLALGLRDHRLLLLAAPAILNAASLVPVIGSPDFRYHYPVVTTGLLILFAAFGRRMQQRGPASAPGAADREGCR